MRSKPEEIVIIGAGASGLAAALGAAEAGGSCLLLEKGAEVGRKLAVAGGGRGNFTHLGDRETLALAYPEQAMRRFLRPAFSALDPALLRRRFADWGLPSFADAQGRVFPRNERAGDLAAALERAGLRAGARIRKGQAVLGVKKAGDCFSLSVRAAEEKSGLLARRLILCTGGKSFPHTGSSGEGYDFARALGHGLSPLRPALQAIVLDEPELRKLSGLSLPAALSLDAPQAVRLQGELLFTHFGLSGPLALDFSRWLGESEAKGALRLDLLPARGAEELGAALDAFCRSAGKKSLRAFLASALPQRLAQTLFERLAADFPALPDAAQSSRAQRRALVELIKSLPLRRGAPRALRSAMLTRGGVKLKEVDPRSLASRVCPGLYLAGEILDIDGPSGGYNLQAAFATGYLAGRSAARG